MEHQSAGGRGGGVTTEAQVASLMMTEKIYPLTSTSNAPFRPGDLLTTATVPGYATKATNQKKAFGTTIGKANLMLDQGTGKVLVLVSLQ